jgi:CO/xanthine dehydrogenase FAD-binding subunit
MTLWKKYTLAKTIQDAVKALANAPGRSCLIAGGTDLLLDLQQGRHAPVDTLVDVTCIPEMTTLEIRQNELFIGAAVPLNRVVASALVRRHAQALQEAGALIGGPQVRNTATLGGNVGHALPAADGTIALMALDASAQVAGPKGTRRAPLAELFLGPGRSALQATGELLVGFYIPLGSPGDCQASSFRRVMRPQGVAIAILNTAIWLRRQADQIANIHVAVGPSGPTPRRLPNTEAILRGRSLNTPPDTWLGEAVEALLSEASLRTSPHRATQAYRRHLAGTLLEETLQAAWQRTF